MTKILSSIIGVLVLAVGILAWQLQVKIKDLAHEQYKNAHLESSLALQNKQIEKMKIDSEAFKVKATEYEATLNKKYNDILAQNKDLQKRLSQIKITYDNTISHLESSKSNANVESIESNHPPTQTLDSTICLNELLAYKETINLSITLLKNRLQSVNNSY